MFNIAGMIHQIQ